MKKLLALSLVLSTLSFAKVLEGTGEGRNGVIKLAVTLDGDKISEIEVVESSDTRGQFNRAINSIKSNLLGKTSTEGVDIVAGSTLSSEGILEAVNNALSQK